MYSRETLAKYIDIALQAEAAPNVVSELMSELEQIPVEFQSEEIESTDLPKFVNDGEVFTENPNYKSEARDFSIYNSDGKLMLTVFPDRTITGRGTLTFTVPFSSPEDKDAFLDFCDKLQKNDAVKFPKGN